MVPIAVTPVLIVVLSSLLGLLIGYLIRTLSSRSELAANLNWSSQ